MRTLQAASGDQLSFSRASNEDSPGQAGGLHGVGFQWVVGWELGLPGCGLWEGPFTS